MITDRELALTLWNYNQLNQSLEHADFIFVMCSYNLTVADRAAELFKDGFGDFIAVSGGMAHQADLLETPWDKPEAVIFAERLIDLQVPDNKIIIEDKATNSGENVQFTKKLLDQKNLKSGIIVQKPYMEKRAYATACQQWAEISWMANSPDVSYEEYVQKFDEEKLINVMVGDTWRIKDFANKGFQIPQKMPEEVEKSLQELMNRGYTKHIKT